MLRDYLTPVLPTLTIGILSAASAGDTFNGLQAAFAGLPNGLAVALAIAIALRLSFYLFADTVARTDVAGWARGLCLLGVFLVMAASAAGGVLPESLLTPVERMTLDGVILSLIAFKNSGIYRANSEKRGGSGSTTATSDDKQPGPNGFDLIDLLERYTVEELGGLFLYAPKPEPVGRARLQPWIALLQARKVIKNDPWVVYPDGIRAMVRANYSHLFVGNPARFYIYRLDRTALEKLVASL